MKYPVISMSLIAACVILVSGCGTISDLLQNASPSAQIETVIITGIDFENIDFQVRVEIDNPNPFGVEVAGFDYDLFIDESSIVNGETRNSVLVAARGTSSVDIPLSLSYEGIFNILDRGNTQEEISYLLAMGVQVAIPGLGNQRLPVRFEGSFPVLRLPSISLSSVRLNGISLQKISLDLLFEVRNPNRYAVGLDKLSFDLEINGRPWVSAGAIPSNTYDSNSSRILRVPVSLNILEVGTSVVQLLRSNVSSLRYRLDLEADISTEIPGFRLSPWELVLDGAVSLAQ